MVGIFRTGIQTGTKISHVPSRVRFRVISGHSSHSGKFWPILAEMQIPVGIGFSLILKKKKKKLKVQTTPACHLPEWTQRPSPLLHLLLLRFVSTGWWTGLFFFYFLLSCIVLSVLVASRVFYWCQISAFLSPSREWLYKWQKS